MTDNFSLYSLSISSHNQKSDSLDNLNDKKKPLIQEISSKSSSSTDLTSSSSDLVAVASAAEEESGINNNNNNNNSNTAPTFKFQFIQAPKLLGFNNKEVQDLLFKWGMQDHCYMKRFTYDKYLEPYQTDEFILNFFNDSDVNPHLKVLATQDRWASLGKVKSVTKETCLHTVTSLSFFDRLYSNGVLRKDGVIIQRLPTYSDLFLIPDELRACMLCPEEETYDSFSKEDRREFIFQLFASLCLGGRLCQYEDEISPYLNVTKKLYKDLIAVGKQSDGKLKVVSYVYKITDIESSVSPLFPIRHPQNFCYVCIDPYKRNVTVFYHASNSYYQ